jgi:hypothetical protein
MLLEPNIASDMQCVNYEILLYPGLPMPSLTWSGKVMAQLVFAQITASLCLLSALDICMPTATPWKAMQSTSSILLTGMTGHFLFVS